MDRFSRDLDRYLQRSDIDDDLRREDIDARRAQARSHHCQCGDDLPGRCPGPMFCPYSDFNSEDEE